VATQRDIDKAAEQASLEAAARVLYSLKPALKAAIKEIYWELWRELGLYLITARWFRILAGLLTLLSFLGVWLKEHIK
jgi:hypothetical protein